MKSIDNHIQNPMATKWLDYRDLFMGSNELHYITQEQYDMHKTHDPETVYIIIDSTTDRMYIGDQEIPKPAHSRQYLMSFDDHRNVYKVYLNLVSNYRDNLVPVAEYQDVKDAVKAIQAYASVGYHTKAAYATYQALGSYIDEEYGINEAIIGIIAAFGYRDDPRLQYLNEEAIHYGVTANARDIPQYYRAALHNLKDRKADSVIVAYSDIYDIFVKYDFFKEMDDLSGPVKDIIACINKYIFN